MSARVRQAHVVDFLQRSFSAKRLTHAYLFFGGNHQDKVELSRYFAKLVLHVEEGDVASNLIDKDENPNVVWIKPEGKNIKKEQIAFLKTESTKSAVEHGAKVYIIEEAEAMSIAATNSLLKFLEEPVRDTHIVLIASAKEVLLPTIVSRTINLNFKGSHDRTLDAELLDFVMEIERSKQPPEIVLAKHQSLFKEKATEFFETYQGYCQQKLDQHLTSNEGSHIKTYIRKIRLALEAQGNLKANMNTQLCLDLFLQRIKEA